MKLEMKFKEMDHGDYCKLVEYCVKGKEFSNVNLQVDQVNDCQRSPFYEVVLEIDCHPHYRNSVTSRVFSDLLGMFYES